MKEAKDSVTLMTTAEVASYLRSVPARPPDPMHFVRRMIAEAYGHFGLRLLDAAAATWPTPAPSTIYEDLEARALDAVRAGLR